MAKRNLLKNLLKFQYGKITGRNNLDIKKYTNALQ